MFLKRRRKPNKPSAPMPEAYDTPLDPALYGKLVDGELPVGWLDFHRAFLTARDEMLLVLAQESANAPDDASARALHEQYLAEYASYQKECAERGECFVKYFSDTHDGNDRPHREWLASHQ
ncbi:MAG: hypothetical protein Q4F79_03920 [Eubacteriales bacterium]|nr:hypothetical protein [Eubacteriales bacterium]